MPITEILICANGPGSLSSRLGLASQIADVFDIYVGVVFFLSAAIPLEATANALPLDDAEAHQAAFDVWDDDAADAAAHRRIYDQWLADEGASPGQFGPPRAGWSEIAGDPAILLPSCARACDLIIAGGANAASSTLDDEISKIALLSSGRMTLFAPRAGTPAVDILRSVLIAWDDSAAASRSIAQAMPLIMAAQEVRLFIGEISGGSTTPCNALLAYLRRKGVNPSITTETLAFRTVRETLVRKSQELGVSLIIMGAYKHSRTHELLLGGTTRYVLKQAGCAVLMVS